MIVMFNHPEGSFEVREVDSVSVLAKGTRLLCTHGERVMEPLAIHGSWGFDRAVSWLEYSFKWKADEPVDLRELQNERVETGEFEEGEIPF